MDKMDVDAIGGGPGQLPHPPNPVADHHGDSIDVEVASSGSSDTSDPDWGVNWGGTVSSSSLPKGAVSRMLARAASSIEEWPSFEPQPAPVKSRIPSGRVELPTGGSPTAQRDPQREFVFRRSPTVKRPSTELKRPETPPWPGTTGGTPTTAASPFAAIADASSRVPQELQNPFSLGREEQSLQQALTGWQGLHLSVISGPSAGQIHKLPGGTEGPSSHTPKIAVGRNSSNTFMLDDDEVSGHHAEIRWEHGAAAWVIRDRGSLNGTLLNGRTISEANRSRGQKHSLSHGDILRLGTRSEVRVAVTDNRLAESAAPAQPASPFLSELPPADPQAQSPAPPSRTLSTPSGTPVKSLSRAFGSDDSAVIGSPAAQLVCASPPRPIRTKSQIPDTTAPAISSPMGATEERSASYPSLGISAAVTSIVGRQHRLKGQPSEDKSGWELPLAAAELKGCDMALFGVYDGHGGSRAAEEVLRRVPEEISQRLGAVLAAAKPGESLAGTCPLPGSAVTAGSDRTSAALIDAFLQLDESLGCDEGCTATCVLVWRGRADFDGTQDLFIQAANVGDSAAVFIPLPPDVSVSGDSVISSGRGFFGSSEDLSCQGDAAPSPASLSIAQWAEECSKGEGRGEADDRGWTPLTTDHRLVNPDEQARLAAVGVHVSKTGRLYGLNLGRSLGDKCLKDADLGLLATPSVSSLLRVRRGCSGLVVIASDGLWDTLSQAGAVDVALRAARGESTPGLSRAEADSRPQPATQGTAVVARVARALLEMAERQKRTDDTTIMVVGVDAT